MPSRANPRPFGAEFHMIRAAGDGENSTVYISLSKYVTIVKKTEPNINNLRLQLCAAKTFRREGRKENLNVLRLIKRACEAAEDRFTDQGGVHLSRAHRLIGAILLDTDADVNVSGMTWFTMTPIFGPTLVELVAAYNPLPEFFVWHVFIQITGALYFLHGLRPRGVAHNSVAWDNIIVDLSKQEFLGLPNLVLVDFADAVFVEREGKDEGYKKDVFGLCELMYHVLLEQNQLVSNLRAHMREDKQVGPEHPFRRFLEQVVEEGDHHFDMSLAAVLEMWVPHALHGRGNEPQSLPLEMQELFRAAQITDDEIVSAVWPLEIDETSSDEQSS